MIRTALTTVAVAAALAATAGSAWFAGAGTALAPEPAMLTAPLSAGSPYDYNTPTAGAYYVNSRVPTSVVKWPSTYKPNTTLPVGTPCSNIDLGTWQQTAQVIVAAGNYRKCL